MRHRLLDHQRRARHALAGQAMLAPQPDCRRLLHWRLREADLGAWWTRTLVSAREVSESRPFPRERATRTKP